MMALPPKKSDKNKENPNGDTVTADQVDGAANALAKKKNMSAKAKKNAAKKLKALKEKS